MRARSILLLLAAAALAGKPARAMDKPIEVRIPDCPSAPLSLDAFLSSLKVELAGSDPPCCTLASPSAGDRDEVPISLRVTLSIEPCDAGTELVQIRVYDSMRATTADRQVALYDIPTDARPRALALAVAELVHAVSQPQQPLVPSSPPLDRALILSGALELRTHPNRNMTLWGFRPSLEVIRGHWQAAVDLEAARGDPSVSLGDVSTSLLSAAVELGPRFHLRHFALEVGDGQDLAAHRRLFHGVLEPRRHQVQLVDLAGDKRVELDLHRTDQLVEVWPVAETDDVRHDVGLDPVHEAESLIAQYADLHAHALGLPLLDHRQREAQGVGVEASAKPLVRRDDDEADVFRLAALDDKGMAILRIGVREVARMLKVSAAKVSEVRRMPVSTADLHS